MTSILFYIIWDVNPNIFPNLEIPKWYGLCWAAGIFLGYEVMRYVYKKEGKEAQQLDILTFYLIIGTLLGARLGHIIFYDPIHYLHHPIEILPVRLHPFTFTGLAGLASHGGGIGIFIALYLYCKKYHENYISILDKVTLVVPLVGAFIRFGNLMNSEMIGIPVDVPWAFIFTAEDNLPRHPAQLYESLFCLFLFLLMFTIWKTRRTNMHDGFLLGLFLILLFSFRFLDEFYKIDQEPFEKNLPINMGQLLSLPFIFGGLFMVIRSYRQRPSNYNKS